MKSAFLNALPIIANSLSDTLGVQVIMGAYSPKTNGKIIYLPSINSDDVHSRNLALGFVSHESAHVRLTDFSLEIQNPLEKAIVNILEDIRIEKAIAIRFPGCRFLLADMVKSLVEGKFFIGLPDDANATQIMQKYMLYQLRQDILEQEGITPLAQEISEKFEQAIPKGMRVRLKALMYQVEQCDSTAECLDLARTIITMMEEEAEKEKEKEQNEPQNQGSDSNPEQSDQGNQSQGNSMQDKSNDSDSENSPADQNQGDSSQDSSNDSGQNTANSGQTQEEESGSSEGVEGQEAADIINQILETDDANVMQDTGSVLQEALGQSESNEPASTYPFQNKRFDFNSISNVSSIGDEQNRVAGAVNALKVRAQAMLQAQTRTVKRSVMAGTKLNMKHLHRARLDGCVFQKNKEGIRVDTAIAILIDRSGSMSGRIGLAMDASLATTLAFDRQDVKTGVFSFPYIKNDIESNAVLKGWNDRPSSTIEAYKSLGVDGSTPMGEAMMGVCYDLAKRPEKRKILLVATDGEPDDKGKAQWVIELARKSGIEVMSVGIMVDTSKVFGSEWSAKIDDIDQLPTAMIGMLDNIMLKKAA